MTSTFKSGPYTVKPFFDTTTNTYRLLVVCPNKGSQVIDAEDLKEVIGKNFPEDKKEVSQQIEDLSAKEPEEKPEEKPKVREKKSSKKKSTESKK